MSLVHCPECSNKISSNAPSCPNCGIEFETKSIRGKANLGCSVLIWLALAGVILQLID